MELIQEKKIRIRSELKKAGVTSYGLLKNESKLLYEVIGDDEHVLGVAYGKYSGGSAMLVATNLRALFFDKKPFVTVLDEISYHVVSGVGVDSAFLPQATVVLHTKMGDYRLRYVNIKCAQRFAKIIEQRALENDADQGVEAAVKHIPKLAIDIEAQQFLAIHNIGVLSTMNRRGEIESAAVHYMLDGKMNLFLLTKDETKKAHNMLAHPEVAFSVFDTESLQTVQIKATAQIESNRQTQQHVYREITGHYGKQQKIAPVAKLKDGKFVIFRLIPTSAVFSDYSLSQS